MSMTPKVSLLGLGLMGGSVAKALKLLQPESHIRAYDSDSKALAHAYADAVIHVCADSVLSAIQDADIVIIAVPPNAIAETLTQILPGVTESMLLMDMTSIKQPVVTLAQAILGEANQQFVPAHPMCGSETSGYAHARADLFDDKTVLMTPTEHTCPAMQTRARQFWHQLGANVLTLSAEEHDEIVSLVSHCPHAISYAFMRTLQQTHHHKLDQFAGQGFVDFTRIAHSSPTLWAQILMANRAPVQAHLAQFIEQVRILHGLLSEGCETDVIAYIEKCQTEVST